MLIDENQYFREAVLRICGSLNLDEVLSRCFEYFKKIFQLDEIELSIYDPESALINIIASATWQGGIFHKPPRCVKLSKEVHLQLRARTFPEVRIADEEQADPVTKEFNLAMERTEASSALIMRLGIGGNRMGALVLRATGARRFTEQHAKLLFMLNEPFGIAFSNSLRYQEVLRLQDLLKDDNRSLRRELFKLSGEQIVGGESGLLPVMEMVRRVAPHSSPVLLLGETGVGKEVIANQIHYLSGRKDGPLIKVNCGAIPETLIDSELFGYDKGAFTGATTQKYGRFERAHLGTIFLDEIGELPLSSQVRLLRVLQSKEVERVGGSGPIKVDTRVIAASNRVLEAMVRSGNFREDLWFRLNVFPIFIPPLRERKEDIPLLVQFFIDRKSKEMGIKRLPPFAQGTMDRLLSYEWPGNVRELENAVERELILKKEQPYLTFDSLVPSRGSDDVRGAAVGNGGLPKFEERLKELITTALSSAHGKVGGRNGAAERLGMNPSTLRSKMQKLRIPYGRATSLSRAATNR